MESDTYETSAESASNFMRWAERRLSQEVESNEKFAKQSNEALDKTLGPKIMDSTLNNNEKILVISKIHQYRDEGKSVVKACKLMGLHPQTYNKWRARFKIPRYKRQ